MNNAIIWKKSAAVIIAITIIIAVPFFVLKKNNIVATQEKILVRTQKPIQQMIARNTHITGLLLANENATITPRANGYINAILVHEGETVSAGQILFQLDNVAEKNALDAAHASNALSQLQFTRDVNLLKRGFITQDMYYAAKVALEQNQTTLSTAQNNFDNRSIRAPFAGVIGSIPISIGDQVNPNTTLTTLVDNTHLRAEYALPASDANQIQLNQLVTIKNENKKITAAISYIAPQIDQSTQTISVHAQINNTQMQLKPGQYITITQPLGKPVNALLVPEQSVLASIHGYSVFLAKNNKAIRTPVKIGHHLKGNVEILSGLTRNDDVIVAGQNQLKNNGLIKIDS